MLTQNLSIAGPVVAGLQQQLAHKRRARAASCSKVGRSKASFAVNIHQLHCNHARRWRSDGTRNVALAAGLRARCCAMIFGE